MTNFTSVPIGSTGENLDGVAVDTAAGSGLIRETVVIADPADGGALAPVSSTLGLSVNVVSTVAAPVNVTTTVSVLPSTQIISSIPLIVSQSTSPWSVNGGVSVTSLALTVSTQIVSSTPFYVAQSSTPWTVNGGLAVTNTPNVSVAALPAVTGSVSTQIVSSIPFFVAQSSAPWDVRGQVNISTHTAIVSTWPLNTTLAQIVSSLPLIVSQSTSPWDIRGQVNISSHSAVASTWPLNTTLAQLVSSLPLIVSQSTTPWDVRGQINISSASAVVSTWPLTTTLVNVVSSLPIFVAQSSAPWAVYDVGSTAGGISCTAFAALANTLNTTVIKSSKGQVYGIEITNTSATPVFVRLYAASNAANVIASTAVPLLNIGCLATNDKAMLFDIGVPFSTGITMITQTQPFTYTTATAPAASSVAVNIFYQ